VKSAVLNKETNMSKKPQAHNQFLDEFPQVADAYHQLATAAHDNGPLDEKTRQLVKLALAIGDRHEGAVHAHTRRALQAEITPEEIKHVVVLAVTSLGMANAVAAYSWVNDVLEG
jgi:4-carboxymuconolactone decarboxylase